jgi:hypothetical protein
MMAGIGVTRGVGFVNSGQLAGSCRIYRAKMSGNPFFALCALRDPSYPPIVNSGGSGSVARKFHRRPAHS